MKKPPFLNNYFYHIFNRGVDKRTVFLDDKDYRRFLLDIKDFNDVNSSINLYRRVNVGSVGSSTSHRVKKDPLVKIICYCLMPNHFHFILKQLKDGGIPSFMRKLGTGYTNYFNQKYKRSGSLFQGRYKAVLIDKDNYLNYLVQYIHLNPADLIEPGWKENGLKNWPKTKKFLESYRWTDCEDYDRYGKFLEAFGPDTFSPIKNLILE